MTLRELWVMTSRKFSNLKLLDLKLCKLTDLKFSNPELKFSNPGDQVFASGAQVFESWRSSFRIWRFKFSKPASKFWNLKFSNMPQVFDKSFSRPPLGPPLGPHLGTGGSLRGPWALRGPCGDWALPGPLQIHKNSYRRLKTLTISNPIIFNCEI